MKTHIFAILAMLCIHASPTFGQPQCFPNHRGDPDWNAFIDKLRPFCENQTDQGNGVWGTGIVSMVVGTKHLVQIENSYKHCSVKDTYLDRETGIPVANKIGRALAIGDNSFRFSDTIDNSKFTLRCRTAMARELCDALGPYCQYKNLISSTSGAVASGNSPQNPSSQPQHNQTNSSNPVDNKHSSGNTPEQQMTQQAAAKAREMQAKGDADAKKQGRRMHDPAMEANDCISIDTSKPGFGLFRNSCNFKVEVAWCNENPKKDSWADVHNCIGKGGQMTGVRANGESASHIKNTERVHWLACKEPALPLEVTFDGSQLQGRCRVLFGN